MASSLCRSSRGERTQRCQESTSTCFAAKSPWNKYSTNLGSNRPAEPQSNFTDLARSMDRLPIEAGSFQSIWQADATTATNATAMETNLNYGPRRRTSQRTRLPSTYATFWGEKSPGYTGGNPPTIKRYREEATGALIYQTTDQHRRM